MKKNKKEVFMKHRVYVRLTLKLVLLLETWVKQAYA